MICLSRGGRSAVGVWLGLAVCACAAAGMFSPVGHARQLRSVTDGVYSPQQAARVQMIYQEACATCHGSGMEGTGIGPPLTGDFFLSTWSARPLSELVDKVQLTMPYDSPGTLSRQESIDLTAAMLQASQFPAGETELSEEMLAQTVLPTVETALLSPTAVTTDASLPPPLGNLAELMRAIAFPNSNVIFNLQQNNPDDEANRDVSADESDLLLWSLSIYPGWLAVDQAAVALTETAPLFLTPGRRCQNGRPVPVDNEDWKQYTANLVEVGELAYAASKARNHEAFFEISGLLSEACENCHLVYRDRGGTEGSGEDRC